MSETRGACIECGGTDVIHLPEVASQSGEHGDRYAQWELARLSASGAVGRVEGWVCAGCGRVELFTDPAVFRGRPHFVTSTREEAWAARDARRAKKLVPPTAVVITSSPSEEHAMAAFQAVVSMGWSFADARHTLNNAPSRLTFADREDAVRCVQKLAAVGVHAEIQGGGGEGPYR